LEILKTCTDGNQHLGVAQDLQLRGPSPWRDLQQRGLAPWRTSRSATEATSTLKRLKTCNRGNQHLEEAQDLQQMGPATWRSSRPATEGSSILEKLKTCSDRKD
jgi:hypothetical protein